MNFMILGCLLALCSVSQALKLQGIGIGSNCTSSSDCDYEGGYCFRYDQCKVGRCACSQEYFLKNDEKCLKLTKIGDRCDRTKDYCLGYASCKAVCVCPDGTEENENRTLCLWRNFGEKCSNRYTNPNYKYHICENNMDCVNSECICRKGYKKSGTTCRQHELGETCDHNPDSSSYKECSGHLICNEHSKCSCPSGTKERIHDFSLFLTKTFECVHENDTINLAAEATCNEENYCADQLICSACRDTANKYGNNTICLSGNGIGLTSSTVVGAASFVLYMLFSRIQ